LSRVPVEVLVSPGCAHAGEVRRRLSEASREEGVELDIVEREVSTPEQARVLRLPGSPTVRVAGRDVQSGADRPEDFGLG
jgi:hypothetical protein